MRMLNPVAADRAEIVALIKPAPIGVGDDVSESIGLAPTDRDRFDLTPVITIAANDGELLNTIRAG